MALPGRPRKHDPIADKIRQAIKYSTFEESVGLIQQHDIEITDGECCTPLIHAACCGNYDVANWLLAHGASVNHQDRDGWSPLHYSIQEKHLDIARLLIKYNADVGIKDRFGNTPLWRAVFDAKGNYDFVTLLIQGGADSETANTAKRSALDFARTIDDGELIELLQNKQSTS